MENVIFIDTCELEMFSASIKKKVYMIDEIIAHVKEASALSFNNRNKYREIIDRLETMSHAYTKLGGIWGDTLVQVDNITKQFTRNVENNINH